MTDIIVFDMDGTLLDTLDDLTNAVNHALEVMGYPARDRDEIRKFLGNGLEVLIKKSLPGGYEESDVDDGIALFKEFYAVHGNDNTKPYGGVVELLEELRSQGVLTAVLSNKYEAAVIELASEYFPGHFDAIRGERENVPRKPAPDGIFSILEELSIDSERAMYVGDSEVDMKTGNSAGVTTVGVLWGFRTGDILENSGAHHTISEPMELLELI